jgi:hypothetical protein
MSRQDEIRIPAALLAAALAAVAGALAMYLAMRRREDARWLDALTCRSGSDERRRGRHSAAERVEDGTDLADLPVANQAIEPLQAPSGTRVSVIR